MECSGSVKPFRSVRGVPELREVVASIAESLAAPLETIRASLGPVADHGALHHPEAAHIATAYGLCDQIEELSDRYLAFIQCVERLAPEGTAQVSVSEILEAIDRRYAAVAVERGLRWSCEPGLLDWIAARDPSTIHEVLEGWVALVIDGARPGDRIDLVVPGDRGDAGSAQILLRSSADELIPDLSTVLDDPLFGKTVCGGTVGDDLGSRLALILERAAMIGLEFGFQRSAAGVICGVAFTLADHPTPDHARADDRA